MTSVPGTIAAELALTRQTIALSVIKSAADQDKAIASILEEAARSAPINGSRGSNVNIKV